MRQRRQPSLQGLGHRPIALTDYTGSIARHPELEYRFVNVVRVAQIPRSTRLADRRPYSRDCTGRYLLAIRTVAIHGSASSDGDGRRRSGGNSC